MSSLWWHRVVERVVERAVERAVEGGLITCHVPGFMLVRSDEDLGWYLQSYDWIEVTTDLQLANK
jgi:hypothetical protein